MLNQGNQQTKKHPIRIGPPQQQQPPAQPVAKMPTPQVKVASAPNEVVKVPQGIKPLTSNEKATVPDVIYDVKRCLTYNKGKFLGKGAFAKCYEVQEANGKTVLACKVVNKGLLVKAHHREKMVQEIAIHRDLMHRHIVSFCSHFEDDCNVYIVLELCAKKSLMEMHKRRRVVTEPESRYFLRQLASALVYLHDEKRIIHRDLKLGNIFINDQMELKVGDFGLATYIGDGERKKTLCGTPNYIAPEILGKRGHGFEVDIWSLGCILYTLLVGKPPFETASLKETYAKIRRAEYSIPTTRVSTTARELITRILQVEPTRRPPARDILTHSFLTNGYIPPFLPVSSLTTAPCFERPKVKPGVGVLVDSSASNKGKIPPNKGTTLKTEVAATSTAAKNNVVPSVNISIDQGNELSSFDLMELMKSLRKQVCDVLKGKGIIQDPTIDDESEDPSLSPVFWISKWVDYSDKFGFGYQLSDDSIGVSYNDQTKLILFPKTLNLHYIERDGKETYHSASHYPEELQKKFKLLTYFQNYMKENLLQTGGKPPQQQSNNCIPRLPNLWSWFRTSRAVVMILSNGTLQINNFRDHTKTLLCPLVGAVSTIDPTSRMLRTFSLSSLKENGVSETLAGKLYYALEKCDVVVGDRRANSS